MVLTIFGFSLRVNCTVWGTCLNWRKKTKERNIAIKSTFGFVTIAYLLLEVIAKDKMYVMIMCIYLEVSVKLYALFFVEVECHLCVVCSKCSLSWDLQWTHLIDEETLCKSWFSHDSQSCLMIYSNSHEQIQRSNCRCSLM